MVFIIAYWRKAIIKWTIKNNKLIKQENLFCVVVQWAQPICVLLRQSIIYKCSLMDATQMGRWHFVFCLNYGSFLFFPCLATCQFLILHMRHWTIQPLVSSTFSWLIDAYGPFPDVPEYEGNSHITKYSQIYLKSDFLQAISSYLSLLKTPKIVSYIVFMFYSLIGI